MKTIRKRVLISGKVHGVGFRAATRLAVSQFSEIRGWVRNTNGNQVEAVFQGDPEQIEALIEWCRNGPPTAVVEKVEVFDEEVDLSLPAQFSHKAND